MAQPAKHTPGPWLINQVQSEPEKITIIDADMCFVAEVWRTYVNGESRQQENAHLIAAAPAMYEALRVLTSEINLSTLNVRKDFSLMNAHACAVKAILQAEGQLL